MTRAIRLECVGVLVLIVASAGPAATPALAQAATGGAAPIASSASYDELFQHYLQVARTTAPGPDARIGWMVDLMNDSRAHRVNDLVTVKVVESITASGTADSSLTKATAANAGVPNLLGIESKLPGSIDPSKLIGVGADSKFAGAGATNRSGVLTAVMTARVAEVLPNGNLVLEGVREIVINGDHQMVVLTGVARTADILPNNTVLSTQIGQLSIRYFGNGLMKDSLKPGFLARLLNKFF